MHREVVTYDIQKDPPCSDEFIALSIETVKLSKDLHGFYKTHAEYKKALDDAGQRNIDWYLDKPNPTIARSGLYVNGALVCSMHTMLIKDISNYKNKLHLKPDIFKTIHKHPLYRHASPITPSAHRGKGYAKELLTHLLRTYTPAMATHIEPDNKASRALYESVGYRVVGGFEIDYGPTYGVVEMPIWYYDKKVSFEHHASLNW